VSRRLPAPVRALRRAVHVGRTIRRAGRFYGAPSSRVLRRLVVARRLGYRLDEARRLGILDPALPEDALAEEFIPSRTLLDLQLQLDPLAMTALVHDKALFNVACRLAGLPVPHVYGVLYRDGAGHVPRGLPPATRSDWTDTLAALPGRFVVKPALGEFGEGLRFFSRSGEAFHEGDRRFDDAAALYDTLLEEGRAGGLLLQERLQNHPFLTELTGSETLQTIRVISIVDECGDPALVTAEWKVVTGDALVDNYHDGVNDNGTIHVDLRTGRLVGPLVVAGPDGFGFSTTDRHPRTGTALEGIEMPGWQDAGDVVLQAARAFDALRTIGWDVAITPEGPVIVEGNSLYAPTNTGSRRVRLALSELVAQRESSAAQRARRASRLAAAASGRGSASTGA
jgi:hypothetical protein